MKRVAQASVEYTVPPWSEPPAGSTRAQIIAWATDEWARDYPEYLFLFLEGGALMGAPIQSVLALEPRESTQSEWGRSAPADAGNQDRDVSREETVA